MTDERDSTAQSPTVRDAGHRYEVRLGDELAGFTEYLDRDGQRIFFHTEIDDRFAGRGLAGILVHDALTATVAAGKRIVPICPYVAKYLGRHDEFAASVDPVTPAASEAVRSARR
ncbi:N-acetyltransferase [Rhodococcus spelaei]|uniref:N-acetyltransferase n=1 Tax=Rhodococcus spelaei TaxID=2546320 RepID=A0A541BRG9_9NOCA|nr:GNAT family N-acetyltransferase [Rhodococcus spelaei]TQF74888.1 N-acetyltransferase [Rhodococcus spelaei]